MRGIFRELSHNGEEGNITMHEDLPMPTLDDNSVLVQVKACGLSLVSGKVLSSLFKKAPRSQHPVGHEVAGIVTHVGEAVTSLKTGDDVVGILPLDSPYPGCADFVAINEYNVIKKSSGVSYLDAAACVGDAVKAYTALHYMARICSGDTILILDGASSSSSVAIQLAQSWGAKVLSTASTAEERLYLEGIQPPLAQVIETSAKGGVILSGVMEETGGIGVDCIIDNGVKLFTNEEDENIDVETHDFPVPLKHEVISSLAVGGRWVTSQADLQIDPPDSQLLYLKSANISYLFHQAWTLSLGQQGRYQHILKDIMNRLEKGTLRPNIVRTVSMEFAVEELKRLSDIRVGKVVMEI
ncbi:quinone oxidoreductase-like protein 1 [Lineus longissimus]|uniref:quinone oxidoreductase-like protein 1 n=1 Tax=Lineus longissimus TaxID=88925 RepID=UPI002B4D3A8C